MPIVLKTRREIEKMRMAGKVAYLILQEIKTATVEGATTGHIDVVAHEAFNRHGAISLARNYPTYKPGHGFPGTTCISVNEEVVHGVPGSRVLKSGDIVSVDLAVQLDGYCGDIACTIPIGTISPGKAKLLDVTQQTLYLAIQNMAPGRRWSDIARLMQHHVESHGFSVVREFVGHGIGRTMHEDPKVPNFVGPEQLRGDFKLRPGMTLAIEPMVVMGRKEVTLLDDGWTVVTEDRQPAAHFEHTIAVTETGVEILTDGRGNWTF